MEESLRRHRDELPNIRYFMVLSHRDDDDFCLIVNVKKGSAMDDTVYHSLESPSHASSLVYTSGTAGSEGVMLQ